MIGYSTARSWGPFGDRRTEMCALNAVPASVID